jgi:hypothetical protein
MTETANKPLTIVKLSAENILRLSAVSITPEGSPVVVIAGDNEAGKSSVLAAIEIALGGEKRIPLEPVRRGQAKAKVVLDLGDIIVTRTFAPKGTTLKVTNRAGAPFNSPQSLLDGLVNKLTFDPMAFVESDKKSQEATLRAIAGLDTTELDTEYRRLFEERTNSNRERDRLARLVESMASYPDAVEVNVDELVGELTAAQALYHTAVEAGMAMTRAIEEVTRTQDRLRVQSATVERVRRELASAVGEVSVTQSALERMKADVEQATEATRLAREAVPATATIRDRISQAEHGNQQARATRDRAQKVGEHERQGLYADELTGKLEALLKAKTDLLASATFPIEGLGLSEDGVTWNDIPFDQASTSVRIRVSAAIGFALNPKLRILRIRNGNDLGEKNLTLLAESAAAVGGQVWVERIEGGKGLFTVVIEDGSVAGAPASDTDSPAASVEEPAVQPGRLL